MASSADLGRRFADAFGIPRGYRPRTKAELSHKLRRRVDDATVAAFNRQARAQAEKGDNPELAAGMARTCAETVREQGGDPSRFERRARELDRHALRRRIVPSLVARAPRRTAHRECRPGGRRARTGTSGSRGDPHSAEGEDDPDGLLARLRRRVVRSTEGAS